MKPGTVTVPVKLELTNAVVVRPGDKLVIGYAQPLNQETVHVIRERLAGMLPGVEAVIIDGVTQLAVYRPEAEDADHDR